MPPNAAPLLDPQPINNPDAITNPDASPACDPEACVLSVLGAPYKCIVNLPHLLYRCLVAIPICGGWCNATVSPEKTCLRQFSNENTVPRPCLWSAPCRAFWESSNFSRLFGSFGLEFADRHRSPIMVTAFFVSFAAWVMIILAALALSNVTLLVKAFAWTTGTVHAHGWFEADVYLGMRSRVIVVHGNYSREVSTQWSDAQACADYSLNTTCAECGNAFARVTTWTVTSIVTQTIQMGTDLQRATPYGDLNCQKLMGVLTGIYGMASGLLSLDAFADSCWRAQPDAFTIRTLPMIGEVHASFRYGPGAQLVFWATAFKVVDIVLHAIVPTPRQKRVRPPWDATRTLPEYMAIGEPGQPTRVGYPLERANEWAHAVSQRFSFLGHD